MIKQYTDFSTVTDFFYDIVISNYDKYLSKVISKSDIYTSPNPSGSKNISVVTNWIPLSDVSDDLYSFEDGDVAYFPTQLGFLTTYTIQSGINGTGQDAINVNVAILQRLMTLLNNCLFFYNENNPIVKNIRIHRSELSSDYNISSDHLEAIVNIYGI
jgi:hypothetical protein